MLTDSMIERTQPSRQPKLFGGRKCQFRVEDDARRSKLRGGQRDLMSLFVRVPSAGLKVAHVSTMTNHLKLGTCVCELVILTLYSAALSVVGMAIWLKYAPPDSPWRW